MKGIVASSGSTRSDDALVSVAEHLFTQFPHGARRVGLESAFGALPPVERADAGELRALRDALPQPSPATSANRLDADRRADIRTAAQAIEVQLFEVEHLGMARWVPADILAATDLSAYLDDPGRDPDLLRDGLERHVAGLSAFLDFAIGALPKSLPIGEGMKAQEEARHQCARLRALTHPAHGEDAVPHASEALAATDRYAEALTRVRLVGAAWGPDTLAGYLEAWEGLRRSPADLLSELEDDLRRTMARGEELARRHGCGSFDALLEHLPSMCGPIATEDELVPRVEKMLDDLEYFWNASGIIPVERSEPYVIEVRQRGGAGAAVYCDVRGIFDPPGVAHRMVLPKLPEAGLGIGPASAQSFLNDASLVNISVHEMLPGHYLQTVASARSGSVLRSSVRWWPGLAEGWAHYTEELAVEYGLAIDVPAVEIAQVRSARDFAARALVYLGVQSRAWTLADAIERLVRWCGWPVEVAQREVVIGSASPHSAMYAIGKLQVRSLRDSLGADSRELRLRYHRFLLEAGYVPLGVGSEYIEQRWGASVDEDHLGEPVGRRVPMTGSREETHVRRV